MKLIVRLRAGCRCFFGAAFLVAASLWSLPAVSAPQGGAPLPWVFVGDSLTAGVQNAALLDREEAMAHGLGDLGQQNSYAGQLALQAGTPMTFPRIAWPGFPNIITDVQPPFVLEQIMHPPHTLGRLNPHEQASNLAVSGATAADALHARPNATCAPMHVEQIPLSLSNTNCVLGAPGLMHDDPHFQVSRSQVEWAEELTAGTMFVLLGANEALGAVLEANPAYLIPVEQFQQDYAQVMDRLAAVSFTLVVSNIPDVTDIPYLTSSEQVAEFLGVEFAQVQALFGLEPGDFVTPPAFAQIHAILANPEFGPLSEDVVLRADEADTIRHAVDGYNHVIAGEAAKHGAVLVDAHGLGKEAAANGIVVRGQRLTYDFGGGLFSLDGVHPTNTGYAVLANQYIHTMNTQLGTGIPPIPLPLVAQDDPLVGKTVGRPPVPLGVVTPNMVQSLRRLVLSD